MSGGEEEEPPVQKERSVSTSHAKLDAWLAKAEEVLNDQPTRAT